MQFSKRKGAGLHASIDYYIRVCVYFPKAISVCSYHCVWRAIGSLVTQRNNRLDDVDNTWPLLASEKLKKTAEYALGPVKLTNEII